MALHIKSTTLSLDLPAECGLKARPRLLDGEKEACLIAIACTEAPEGRGAWTLRLLADKMVELGHVEGISHETVRQTLKKTN